MTTTDEQSSGSVPFPETADIETSSDDYASRFSGPTGEWMLDIQEKIVLDVLKDTPNASILDVGGGHGQLAIPLCHRDFKVTVLSSSKGCRKRISDIVDSAACAFKVGNVIELPFADRSFDTTISFRMLTHCRCWPRLIEELCRVARYSVMADYPTNQSLNKIAPMLFEAKKRVEGNTRTWSLFRHKEILSEFEKQGFALNKRKAQFFLPMVLHRALKCRTLSAVMEAGFRGIKLTTLWGSPVIIEMIRKRP